MAFQVIWTPRGERAFEEIIKSLVLIDPDAADRLQDRIFETTALLEHHPYIGATYERNPMYREILCDRHRIFYSVSRSRKLAAIHMVWHSSRDEPEL